jgi:L-threonylcarbamoyladenylate synthase
VGLRVPDHVVALALLDAAKQIGVHGIAAPSANRFGHVSPTTAEAVREELDQYLSPNDFILDGGPSQVGVESTIIDCTTGAPQILRPGSISYDDVASISNLALGSVESLTRVSGNFESHYAPNARIILDIEPMEGQGLIAFDNIPTPLGVIRILSPNTSVDFARGLYSALRNADKIGLKEIVVYQPEDSGIGIAIRDRLGKAAFGPRK